MKSIKNNKGQSTIEFIMTFSAAIGFIFLFLKMAMNYTDGFMVHHATFMAARSYMVNDDDRKEKSEGDSRAFTKAKEVFTKYMPEGLINGVDSSLVKENNPGSMRYHAFVGLHVEFFEKFSLGFIGGKKSIRMVSEAFLGREPTRAETREQVCSAIKYAMNFNKCEVFVTLEDNGG